MNSLASTSYLMRQRQAKKVKVEVEEGEGERSLVVEEEAGKEKVCLTCQL